MKKWIVMNRLYFFGAIIGMIAGLLYWKYVGCVTGTCPITSSPVNSSLYFGFLGAIVSSFFKKEALWKEKKN
ncbi:MAG: hypothetical protein ACXVKM_14215 [Flavisolibacter sp.]